MRLTLLLLLLPAPAFADDALARARAAWSWTTTRSEPVAVAEHPVTLIVIVPNTSTVYLQGQRIVTTGNRRTFVSPPLKPGEYTYTVRCVDEVGAEQTKEVKVWPGQTVTVEFPIVRVPLEGIAVPREHVGEVRWDRLPPQRFAGFWGRSADCVGGG